MLRNTQWPRPKHDDTVGPFPVGTGGTTGLHPSSPMVAAPLFPKDEAALSLFLKEITLMLYTITAEE